MSRIGKKPVTLPKGVEIKVTEENLVTVKGPKGTLTQQLHPEMVISQENGALTVERPSDGKLHKALHGLTRTLINNMVVGVTDGWQRALEINGVGYRAVMEGKTLVLNLGFSHQVIYPFPPGITIDVEQNTKLSVKGIDKEMVGQVAAELRSLRPPDSYKGKGVRFQGERVRIKAGKAAQK